MYNFMHSFEIPVLITNSIYISYPADHVLDLFGIRFPKVSEIDTSARSFFINKFVQGSWESAGVSIRMTFYQRLLHALDSNRNTIATIDRIDFFIGFLVSLYQLTFLPERVNLGIRTFAYNPDSQRTKFHTFWICFVSLITLKETREIIENVNLLTKIDNT